MTEKFPSLLYSRVVRFAVQMVLWVVLAFVAASLIGGSFAVLVNPGLSGPIFLALINANLVIILILAIYIGRKVMLVFLERTGVLRGARLHVRLLGIFSFLAVAPALLVSVFAIVMLNQGIESWFSRQVTQALDGSLQVAQSYLQEQQKTVLAQTEAVAREPALRDGVVLLDPALVREVLNRERVGRNLDEVGLFNRDGQILSADTESGFAPTLENEVLQWAAVGMGSEVFQDLDSKKITAVTPAAVGLWLFSSKTIDPSVLARVDETQAAYQQYYGLRKNRVEVQLIFTLFMVLLALGSLAAAVWTGWRLAGRIVKPVTELVHATNRVSSGDLDVRLTPLDDDEMGILTQSFNRMARQLKASRELLEKKNLELDDRRRTMEAVFTGITAGVMGVDDKGIVRHHNRMAQTFLNARTGLPLKKFSEELQQVFDGFIADPREGFQQNIKVLDEKSAPHTLLVRMVPQRVGGGKVHSVVITFDDITQLISAQRTSAWADVAQRIAHEIKNPLTPIQLSAERLKRKYLEDITGDKQLFTQLTDTIVRQAEDMRQMINEFSGFARMPQAVFGAENLITMLDEIILLQRTARPNISFETDYQITSSEAEIECDRAHLTRVFTNIIENAVNAIEENDRSVDKKGFVKIVVKMQQGGILTVDVLDNGRGLPEDMDTERLFDPYITTRKKGTGLGLAIVRRVMDEHNGTVRLYKRAEGGAGVSLTLPLRQYKTIQPTSSAA